MTSSLRRELELITAWLILLLILGGLIGQMLVVLCIGSGIYIVWNLYNLNRLSHWLSKPSKHTPETWGIWEDVYYQLYHLYKRQRKARRKLASILDRFQKSTHALPYATIILNAVNEIEWLNPAASHLFSLQAGHDIGQRIENLIRQPVFTSYLAARQFEKPLEFKHNKQILVLTITAYGKEQYLLSARDITQAKQLDEMRRDFISNASHELRTPLTVMSGYLEVLCERKDADIQKPLEIIQQQTRRMENIITELIGLAKLETATINDNPQPVNLDVLLNEIYAEAMVLDQGKHLLSSSIQSVEIRGNYAELRTAFSNLLTNAIRYTPEGGAILLFTSTDEAGVCVGVKDEGIGIDYQHIPRLTERFYRVDEGRSREKGGTGLGLAIVRQVLERHNAILRIESEPGKGSVFSCYFPQNY